MRAGICLKAMANMIARFIGFLSLDTEVFFFMFTN